MRAHYRIGTGSLNYSLTIGLLLQDLALSPSPNTLDILADYVYELTA